MGAEGWVVNATPGRLHPENRRGTNCKT